MPEQQPDDLVTKLGEPDWMRGACQCYPAGVQFGTEPGNAWGCPQHGAEADAWRAGRDAALTALADAGYLVLPAADVIPKATVVRYADWCERQGIDFTRVRELRALVAGGES